MGGFYYRGRSLVKAGELLLAVVVVVTAVCGFFLIPLKERRGRTIRGVVGRLAIFIKNKVRIFRCVAFVGRLGWREEFVES